MRGWNQVDVTRNKLATLFWFRFIHNWCFCVYLQQWDDMHDTLDGNKLMVSAFIVTMEHVAQCGSVFTLDHQLFLIAVQSKHKA